MRRELSSAMSNLLVNTSFDSLRRVCVRLRDASANAHVSTTAVEVVAVGVRVVVCVAVVSGIVFTLLEACGGVDCGVVAISGTSIALWVVVLFPSMFADLLESCGW